MAPKIRPFPMRLEDSLPEDSASLTFPSRLRRLRERKGWSRMEVATRLKVSLALYASWEEGGLIAEEFWEPLAELFSQPLDGTAALAATSSPEAIMAQLQLLALQLEELRQRLAHVDMLN